MTLPDGQNRRQSLDFLTQAGTVAVRVDTVQRLIVALTPIALTSTVFGYFYTNPDPIVGNVLGIGSLLLGAGLYACPPQQWLDTETVAELTPTVLPQDTEVVIYEQYLEPQEPVTGQTVVFDILSPQTGWRYVTTNLGDRYRIDRVVSFPASDPPPAPEPVDEFRETDLTDHYEFVLPDEYATTVEQRQSLSQLLNSLGLDEYK